MTASSIVSRHPAVAWQRVEGEVVVVQPEQERILGLNASAGFIWDRLEGTASLGEIALALAEHWQIPAEQAEREVLLLAEQLCSRQLAMVIEGVR